MILMLMTALAQAAPNQLTDEEKKAGWKLLFDGKTTEGWRGYKKDKMPDGWKVVDGALARVDGGGDIVTAEEYDNFELSIEWKVAPKGNSGIMFRVAEGDGPPYHTGPEYQILDNGGHGDGKNPLTSAGSCYAIYAPSKDVTQKPGEWNQTRLVANGGKMEHWLNGEKVVAYEIGGEDWNKKVAGSKFKDWGKFGKEAKGRICLQDHGDRVEYRSIMLKPLPKATCHRCGGRVVPIVYGKPGKELIDAEARGEIVLAGCEPKPETHQCRGCGEKFGPAAVR